MELGSHATFLSDSTNIGRDIVQNVKKLFFNQTCYRNLVNEDDLMTIWPSPVFRRSLSRIMPLGGWFYTHTQHTWGFTRSPYRAFTTHTFTLQCVQHYGTATNQSIHTRWNFLQPVVLIFFLSRQRTDINILTTRLSLPRRARGKWKIVAADQFTVRDRTCQLRTRTIPSPQCFLIECGRIGKMTKIFFFWRISADWRDIHSPAQYEYTQPHVWPWLIPKPRLIRLWSFAHTSNHLISCDQFKGSHIEPSHFGWSNRALSHDQTDLSLCHGVLHRCSIQYFTVVSDLITL